VAGSIWLFLAGAVVGEEDGRWSMERRRARGGWVRSFLGVAGQGHAERRLAVQQGEGGGDMKA
jgi:hypothetical protein